MHDVYETEEISTERGDMRSQFPGSMPHQKRAQDVYCDVRTWATLHMFFVHVLSKDMKNKMVKSFCVYC